MSKDIDREKAIKAIAGRIAGFVIDAGKQFLALGDFEWAGKADAALKDIRALESITKKE